VDVLDVPRAVESAITADARAAATIQVIFFDSNRRSLGQRACSVGITEADASGEDASGGGVAAPAPPAFPETEGPEVALDTGSAGRLWWRPVGS
jgi:hypothetical protein